MIRENNFDNFCNDETLEESPIKENYKMDNNLFLNRKRKSSDDIKVEEGEDFEEAKKFNEEEIKEDDAISITYSDDFVRDYYSIVNDGYSRPKGGLNILLGSHLINLPLVSVKKNKFNPKLVKSVKEEPKLFDDLYNKIKIMAGTENQNYERENIINRKEIFKMWAGQNFYQKEEDKSNENNLNNNELINVRKSKRILHNRK